MENFAKTHGTFWEKIAKKDPVETDRFLYLDAILAIVKLLVRKLTKGSWEGKNEQIKRN